MKKGSLFLFVLTVFFITTHGSALAFKSPLQFGWVIGNDENNTVILHTKDGGKKWVVQGKWAGYGGNDISAVDRHTAWAALGSPEEEGIILHTTNGGVTWTEQTLPEGVDTIKGIKGLTRYEAWAVSYTGKVLHTTDGGEVWNTVDLGIDLGDVGYVNRMDAIGCRCMPIADNSGRNTEMIHANVWFTANYGNDGNTLGMIHTLYNGEIWRKESIPFTGSSGVHMLGVYSPRVAWAAAWKDGHLFRTEDGGENWEAVAEVGINDIDDMCAYSADALWLVQFQGSVVPGIIYHVSVEGVVPDIDEFHPVDENGNVLLYYYAGLTCVDDQTALVVGYTVDINSLQKGIILLTNDGGQTWERQPLPVDDVQFWKVSFVGARR